MKLRTSLKIMRAIHGDGWRKHPRWNVEQIWRARDLGRRKCSYRRKCGPDQRFPYIPDEDELKELYGIRGSILLGLFIEDEAQKQEAIDHLWEQLEGVP